MGRWASKCKLRTRINRNDAGCGLLVGQERECIHVLTTASYIIALMGCSHDLDICSTQSAMPTTYASRQACIADLDRALEAAKVDGPMIVAECQRISSENAHLVVQNTKKHAALTR